MATVKVKPLSDQELLQVRKNNNIIMFQKHEIKLNDNGFQDSLLLLEEKYNSQGSLISEYQLFYDDRNQINEEHLSEYFDNGKTKHQVKVSNHGNSGMKPIIKYGGQEFVIFSEKEEIFYDDAGRQVSTIEHKDNHIFKSFYQWNSDSSYFSAYFDPLGTLTDKSYNVVDLKGNTIARFNVLNNYEMEVQGYYEYDKFGNEIIVDIVNKSDYTGISLTSNPSEENFFRYRVARKYNDNNKLIEKLNYEAYGNIEQIENLKATGQLTYEYDQYNNEIKSIYNYSDTTVYTTEYKYDNFGNILESLHFENGNKISIEKNYYNNNGYLIKTTDESVEDKQVKIKEYEYNDIGLITKETLKEGDKENVYIYTYFTPPTKSIK